MLRNRCKLVTFRERRLFILKKNILNAMQQHDFGSNFYLIQRQKEPIMTGYLSITVP